MSPVFLVVLLVSLALKVVFALAAGDIEPRYDERQFLRFSQEWTEKGTLSTLWRAPGYQWFMGVGLLVGGGNPIAVRLLQVLLSTATAFLVYRIGREQWNERVGLAAGAMVAFYPEQIAFSHLLWSETLYGFLFLLAFERLLATDRDGGFAAAVVAGLALGAASLTRSTGLGLLVVSAIWLFWRRRRRGGGELAATAVLAAACFIVPWSLYASARAGCLVVVDLNGPFNLWSGNSRYAPTDLQGLWGVGLPAQNGVDTALSDALPDEGWRQGVPWQMARAGIPDRFGCAGADWYRDEALADMGRHPGVFLSRIPLRIAGLWSPDFFLSRHLLRDWYGELSPGLVAFLVILAVMASVVSLVGGSASLAALPSSRFRSLALVWIALYIAAHALTFGLSRMHFPLIPLLLLAVAAFLFAAGARRPAPDWSRLLRRGGPWALLVCLAWLWLSPTLVGLYVAPGPGHLQMARALGSVRALPVPGTRYAAWMLAMAEASNGNVEIANRILMEPGHAEHPWSLYLRGQLASEGPGSVALLEAALERDPGLYAALRALGVQAIDRGDFKDGIALLERAQAIRPWDPVLRSALLRARELHRRESQP